MKDKDYDSLCDYMLNDKELRQFDFEVEDYKKVFDQTETEAEKQL